MGSELGAFLLFCGLVPMFSVMIVTQSFGILTGAGLWIALGIAIGLGLIAAITAIGSGLNTFGTFLTFVLAFATSIYVIFMVSVAGLISGIPYNGAAIIDGISVFCYVMGLFLIISSRNS
jgi:hypothetical protein